MKGAAAEKVAAVVVLYHPDAGQVSALVASLQGQVGPIYLVDNSVPPVTALGELLQRMEQVRYLPNHANLGIAAALNCGAHQALQDGCDLLLTMDQDSNPAADMVAQMLAVRGEPAHQPLGMLAPFQITPAQQPSAGLPLLTQVMTPMTSGCLLELDAYRSVGPFRGDFFIDFVDNEYCLRLRRAGFGVIRVNRALLRHQVGELRTYGPFVATNHGPLRRYYKSRNRLYVFVEYFSSFPGHCLFDLIRLLKEIGSILLFEQGKAAKFRMMLRGALHFLQGRSGSFEEASR